jgi:hypothetical protein
MDSNPGLQFLAEDPLGNEDLRSGQTHQPQGVAMHVGWKPHITSNEDGVL